VAGRAARREERGAAFVAAVSEPEAPCALSDALDVRQTRGTTRHEAAERALRSSTGSSSKDGRPMSALISSRFSGRMNQNNQLEI
jgi:hypothetical protein